MTSVGGFNQANFKDIYDALDSVKKAKDPQTKLKIVHDKIEKLKGKVDNENIKAQLDKFNKKIQNIKFPQSDVSELQSDLEQIFRGTVNAEGKKNVE